MGDTTTTQRVVPLEGPPEEIAAGLRAYATEGVSEVQVVLDPIDRASVERIRSRPPDPGSSLTHAGFPRGGTFVRGDSLRRPC